MGEEVIERCCFRGDKIGVAERWGRGEKAVGDVSIKKKIIAETQKKSTEKVHRRIRKRRRITVINEGKWNKSDNLENK